METKPDRKPTRYGRDPEISARNQDRIRSLIQVEKIVKKLNDHILGHAKMTNTMVRSAEILLRKIQPDLTAIQLSHDDGVGVPLLKIVRAAQPELIEHEPVDGAELQTRDVSASSSKVLPD
jgi:hypothetical protein